MPPATNPRPRGYAQTCYHANVMKLEVLPSTQEPPQPWYADGLRFTCTQCGNCCTGPPGYVWISDDEVGRLAEFLKLSGREVRTRYCRKVGSRWSLRERKTPQGNYDCVFLREEPLPPRQKRELAAGEPLPHRRRTCSIYPVRPLQCRTWPFWESNLSSPKMWRVASRKCPGINRGPHAFTRDQIEMLRHARDWPDATLSS